tara:strand:+ start:3660 stop:4244 length:585 start_codon:yes stop_codon:yes gene_type:complete
MKTKIITIIAFLLTTQFFYAQEEKEHESFFTETEWKSEFFPFPIGFAREIPLEGIEEAVFPPGWGKTESPEFWSYLFVWNVKTPAPLTLQELETYLNYYFDGLLNIKNRKNGTTILPTSTLLTTSATTKFIGTVHLFEGRYTQKMMYLHTYITQDYCEETNEATLVFKFSPKGFNDRIWEQFQEISLKNGICPD